MGGELDWTGPSREVAVNDSHQGVVTCVLFDLYGTLLDVGLDEDQPALWQGLATALRACGGTVGAPDDVRRRFRQILGEEAARAGEGFLLDATFRRLLAGVGARGEVASLGRVFRQLSIRQLSIRTYVAPMFAALRQTACHLGIVSNTEAVLTHFDLDRFPILRSVDTLVLSSEVGVRKPDPRIFRIALDRLQVPAGTAVFVGNSLDEDVLGARRADLRAIHVDDSATGVDRVAGDPSVLRAAPTAEALRQALQMFGWQASSPATQAGSGS